MLLGEHIELDNIMDLCLMGKCKISGVYWNDWVFFIKRSYKYIIDHNYFVLKSEYNHVFLVYEDIIPAL